MNRYYSTRRPITPGVLTHTAQDAAIEIVNFDNPEYIDKLNRTAWGYIETAEPLNKSDISNSDLTDPDEIDEHALLLKVAYMFVEEGYSKRDAYKEAKSMTLDELMICAGIA